MNVYELTGKHPLTACLEPENLKSAIVLGRIKAVRYEAGCLIHSDQDDCDKLEVVLSGEVQAERLDEQGRSRLIDYIGSGGILGGNLMFSEQRAYLMNVSAVRNTLLLEFPTETLFSLLSANQKFLRVYLSLTAQRTVQLGERIRLHEGRRLRELLLDYLADEAARQQSTIVRLPLSKTELARRLGVERSSVSRELAKMQAGGDIRVEGRVIRLLCGVESIKK